MFSAPLDTLEVDVRANLESFESELSFIKKKTRETGEEASRSFGRGFKGGIDGLLGPLRELKAGIAAAAVALGVGKVVGFAKSTLEAADALNSLTQALGVSIERYQEFRFAAQLAGVSEEKFRSGFSRFSNAVADAKNGNDQYIAAFNKLGIALVDRQGDVRNTADLFDEFFHKLEQVESQTERTALVVDLFGKENAALANLGQEGGRALDTLTQKAREMGLVLSEETVKSLAEAKTQMDVATEVINANLTQAFAGLATTIANVSGNVIEMVEEFKEFLGMFKPGGDGDQALQGLRNQLAQVDADIAHRMRDRGKWYAPADTEQKIRELEARKAALLAEIDKLDGAEEISVPKPRPTGTSDPEEARRRNATLSKKASEDAKKADEERIRLSRELQAQEIRATEDRIAIASYEYAERVRLIKAAGYTELEMKERLASAERTFASEVAAYDKDRAEAAKRESDKKAAEAKRIADAAKREAEDRVREVKSFTDKVAGSMVESGRLSFKQLADDFRKEFLKRAISDFLASGLLSIGKKIGIGAASAEGAAAGPGGAVGALLTGAKFLSGFAGFFAGGGGIGPGQFGIVGEQGPEIVTGGGSGARVFPLRRGAGGGEGTGMILQVYAVGKPEEVSLVQGGQGPDGAPILRLVVGAVAEDLARGGATAQAVASRFAVAPRVAQ